MDRGKCNQVLSEGLEAVEAHVRRPLQWSENDAALLGLHFSGLPFPYDPSKTAESCHVHKLLL